MDWLEAAIAAAGDEPMPCSVIPDVVPGRLVQIDGDYAAYFMAGNDDTDSGTARRNLMQRFSTIKEMTGASGVVVHLSADGCTKADRFLIATVQPYQEQRAGSARPKNWRSLREFMESYKGPAFTPKIWGDREADDGMAYMQQKWVAEGKGELIVTATRDKDMRQYPGWHMDWMTYQLTYVPQGAYEVIGANDLIYGHKWLWLQTLQGDGADHIKGLPFHLKPNGKWESVGDARALVRLAGIDNDADAFDEVVRLYDTYYTPTAGLLRLAETLLLVWLRRDQKATFTDMVSWLQLRDDQKARLTAALLEHQKRVQDMKAEVKRIEANQQST